MRCADPARVIAHRRSTPRPTPTRRHPRLRMGPKEICDPVVIRRLYRAGGIADFELRKWSGGARDISAMLAAAGKHSLNLTGPLDVTWFGLHQAKRRQCPLKGIPHVRSELIIRSRGPKCPSALPVLRPPETPSLRGATRAWAQPCTSARYSRRISGGSPAASA